MLRGGYVFLFVHFWWEFAQKVFAICAVNRHGEAQNSASSGYKLASYIAPGGKLSYR